MSTHPAELEEAELTAQCKITRTRRSGPGGQHRNKVETAIVIEHEPSGVRAEASERRSQEENRRMAIQRLRLKLALAVRAERSADEALPVVWQSRVKQGRIRINENHADFPTMLAVALDVIVADAFDLPAAAERLACSSSQLVKLLQKEPAALAYVNRERSSRDLRPLR